MTVNILFVFFFLLFTGVVILLYRVQFCRLSYFSQIENIKVSPNNHMTEFYYKPQNVGGIQVTVL